jgi:hypothetical protein
VGLLPARWDVHLWLELLAVCHEYLTPAGFTAAAAAARDAMAQVDTPAAVAALVHALAADDAPAGSPHADLLAALRDAHAAGTPPSPPAIVAMGAPQAFPLPRRTAAAARPKLGLGPSSRAAPPRPPASSATPEGPTDPMQRLVSQLSAPTRRSKTHTRFVPSLPPVEPCPDDDDAVGFEVPPENMRQ